MREPDRLRAAAWAFQAAGIACTITNGGHHIRIPTQRGTMQYWPSTNRVLHPGSARSYPTNLTDVLRRVLATLN